MSPKEIVLLWIDRFNKTDVDGLAALYAVDAINHQVVMEPLHGREKIKKLFQVEFSRAKMVCVPEQIHEAGDWAILEWSDPLGMKGCGFFQIKNDQIVFQRGYFDQLTFFKIQGLPIPKNYLNSD